MDRLELAERNCRLTDRRHRRGARARLRNLMLGAFARLHGRPRPGRADSILLIRPDHLGDVLLTTPAIRALARACPDAEITALVGPWSAGVLSNYAELSRVLTLAFPGFTRGARGGRLAPYRLARRSAKRLRALNAGAAVVMRPDHWWGALLAHLAGIPVRLGYDLPGVRPFLTGALPFRPEAHSARLNLNLVAQWTGPIDDAAAPLAHPVAGEDAAYIERFLADQGYTPGAPLVVIHPGSGSPYKAWVAARWAEVAGVLAARLDAQIVLTGAANEAHMVRAIARGMLASRPPIIAAGCTTVEQLAALLARAALVLGTDSGPLHLAVAVGAPTVHLYGPANPAIYGPWGAPERHAVVQSSLGCVPCSVLDWAGDDPANHPCLQEISVAQVLAAASAVLSEGGQRNGAL
jgi:heptosyltransferase-2/heptosyltransferase-3